MSPAPLLDSGPRRRSLPAAASSRPLGDYWRRPELFRRTLLGGVAAVIGFAVLAFGGVYGWVFGTAYSLLFLLLGAWTWQFGNGRLPLRRVRLYWPMVAFAGLCLWQYAFHQTPSRGDTLTEIMHLAAAGSLFFLVTQCVEPADSRWLLPAIALFTAAVGLMAVLQLLTGAKGIYWTYSFENAASAGSYVDRDHFAGCMELLLPMTFVQAVRRPSLSAALVWSLPVALGGAALLLTASRGGAIAVTVQIVLGLLLWGYHRLRSETAQQVVRRSSSLTILIVVLVVAAYIGAVGFDRLGTRFSQLNNGSLATDRRTYLNLSAITMWDHKPIAGWGLNSWKSVYPNFAYFDDLATYEFAHNDYLQLLAEDGLLGAFCTMGFGLLWLLALTRPLQRPVAEEASAWCVLGAAVGFAGMLVHTAVDFNLHIPANLLLFFFMAGLALMRWLPEHTVFPEVTR